MSKFKESDQYVAKLIKNLKPISVSNHGCVVAVATTSREIKTVGEMKQAMLDYYLGNLEE